MAKINVQFHAEPIEIIRFLKDCAKKYDLHIVIIENNPNFVANLIIETEYTSEEVKIDNTSIVCLSIKEPYISTSSYLEFLDKNSECLSITIGKFDDNRLVESVLAAQTDNADSLKAWKSIVKELEKISFAGAWVVNPNNRAKAFYKQHRYTEGAKKLFEDGVKIVPTAGWNYFVLDQ